MSEEKRYYWIKLKDAFLTSDTVDFLMGQKNGANYVVLYQMLCLKTANTNGVLGRQLGELLVPYDAAKIQRDCKYFDFDTVVVALGLYQKLGLVYVQEDGMLKIANFDNLIGSEGEAAERMRNIRAKAKNQQNKLPGSTEQSANNVRTRTRKEKVIQKEKEPEQEQEIEPEIERDLETDTEKDKEKDKANTVSLSDCLNSLPEKVQFYYDCLISRLEGNYHNDLYDARTDNTFRAFIAEVAAKEVSTINGRPTPREVILRAYQYFTTPDGYEVLSEILGQVDYKWRSGEVKNRYAYTVSTLYNTCLNNGCDGWDAIQ